MQPAREPAIPADEFGAPGGRQPHDGFLTGIRVIELADELGEYCGKLLAGLGAEVIKVEPRGGERTRTYGPFADDEPGPDRSLYFWHYNYGKRSVVIDLDDAPGLAQFRRLLANADVLLDARPADRLPAMGLDAATVRAAWPDLIHARISPFGDDGPWAHYRGSDLVHLALGGVMMNCGYDPGPSGHYDTPPIAPQMNQAYQIAGEMAVLGILGALHDRLTSGRAVGLTVSVHEAVSMNTETDLPNWIYLRQTHLRQTGRHSRPTITPSSISETSDGRWVLPYRTYLRNDMRSFQNTVRMLRAHGAEQDLGSDDYLDDAYRARPEIALHVCDVVDAFIRQFRHDDDVWRLAQKYELAWAPIRYPHENLDDEHWKQRQTFVRGFHPEAGRDVTQIGARWYCEEVPWRLGHDAPSLGQDTNEVLRSLDRAAVAADRPAPSRQGHSPSTRERPMPLDGVRIIDLSWLLASAGSGRYLAALGAEIIKVEHSSHWDTMRWGIGMAPRGGRAAREQAVSDLPTEIDLQDPNRSGSFMEINAGKRGISLNIKHPRGMAVLKDLIRQADMVVEGFSPGTMDRLGLGYAQLRELNPSIIYVQQSGLGQRGTYGGLRTYGPSAAAFSGIFEQSGLERPYPPTGIGYSYLDWFGAYNMACAMSAALLRKRRTGRGCYIDSSQVETGIYLSGTAVLDYSVNARPWHRDGNRAVGRLAAPHGVFRTWGTDRWIAITCRDDDEWAALTQVLDLAELSSDQRFASAQSRLQHEQALADLIEARTTSLDGYELMDRLQRAGVPAGVCQNAQDRVERDPQLAHLGWLTELPQSAIGTWPVKRIPVTYAQPICQIGGSIGRSGPSYGEDNDYVFSEVLGLSSAQIAELGRDGVI